MGFKLGAIVGFGAGYYLGAKAGRERYEQINRFIDQVKQSDAYGSASERARDLAAEGVGAARARLRGEEPQGPASTVDLPGDYSPN